MSSLLIPDCYQYIVGLSRTECECYTPPADADESLSGLYIDELESLSAINSSINCENGAEVFAQIEKARQIAITTFQGETNALIMRNFKLRKQNYYGVIGRAIAKAPMTQAAGQWYGVRMFCANVKSGVLVIKNMGAMFTQTGVVSVQIWNNLGDLIQTVSLNTLANKHYNNPVDIELPLHSPYIENLEYYFIYQVGANVALNNDIKCNCGGFKPYFDTGKPYLTYVQNDRNYGWSNWVMVGSFNAATLPNFGVDTLSNFGSNQMNGLTFEVELKCKISEVLCYESLDFETNNLAIAMAMAIQHKAASILGSWIVNSGNLNRFTMINTEQLIADIAKWDKIYIDMITFISQEVDITTNDCLACKDVWEMAKRGILA